MSKTDSAIERQRGQQLTAAETNVLIAKMIDYMTEGLMSTNALSKKLGVSRRTVDRYRPLADDVIGRQKINRNAIRNLQIRRTYELIEMLMQDLKAAVSAKDRSAYYSQIFKFSSHLALITGLNVETQVTVDPTKLVIIRAKTPENGQRQVIDVTTEEQQ